MPFYSEDSAVDHQRKYWEIILRKNLGKRKKIVTAYITSSLKPFIVNDRIEKIEYQKE